MTEDYDDDSYEYYSDYEDCEDQIIDQISYNPSPYSKTPMPDFSDRELEASNIIRKWLKNILNKSEDDIKAFLEKNIFTESEKATATKEDRIRTDVSNICSIEGDFDQVDGEAEIQWTNGDLLEVGAVSGVVREHLDNSHLVRTVHCRRGVRHGPFVEYRPAGRQLLSVGRFHGGIKCGTCWTATRGGGYLVGEVITPSGQTESLHHGDVVFLYPDLVTAIQGEFSHGRLVAGRLTHVSKVRLNGFIPTLEVEAPPSGQSRELYTYQPAGSLCISRSPLLRDPFECRYVFVSESRTGEGAGEGLFAKTNIPRGQLCALFNGVRQRRLPGQYLHQPEWSDYRIGCGAETDLDILPGQETLTNYRATLAHKVCHSFNNNCSFAQLWHPRFGNIMSVVADRDIKSGEELCVSYNYKLDYAPNWYRELWTRHCQQA